MSQPSWRVMLSLFAQMCPDYSCRSRVRGRDNPIRFLICSRLQVANVIALSKHLGIELFYSQNADGP